jgi:hypothetical protein
VKVPTEPGFYWLRSKNSKGWEIAERGCHSWHFCGDEAPIRDIEIIDDYDKAVRSEPPEEDAT